MGGFTRVFSRRWLQAASTAVADAIAPCHCAVCGLPSARPLELCVSCECELPWFEYGCARCALPMAGDNALCGRCLQQPPAFDSVTAACLFTPPVSGLVHALKDAGQLATLPVLVELLAQAVSDQLAEQRAPDVVVPMPLHWTRRWRRGFNQAALLASGLCKHPRLADAALSPNTRLCRRLRPTPSQRALGARRRRQNLRRAMACTASLDGRSVAVVDDVLTTGASADALAAVLKAAGAERVDIWCCARTPAPRR